MGKLYTIDEKLLTGTPEIRIADKIYPVDDRQKTVKKLMKQIESVEVNADAIDDTLKLALGDKAFKEIDAMNISFAAYQSLFATVIAAMTGEEPEEVTARFQKAKAKQ